jgi:hypothetical protein
MKTRVIITAVLFVIAIFFTSCFYSNSSRWWVNPGIDMGGDVQNPEMPFERPLYSILPPQEKGWTYVIKADTYDYILTFRKEAESKTHTYVGMVKERQIYGSFSSPEEFLSFVKKNQEWNADRYGRYSVLESKISLNDRFGAYCVSYYVKVKDYKAQQKDQRDFLIMEVYGYTFLHPNKKNIMVDVGYSERGTADEIDTKFIDTAQKFLNGFKINWAIDRTLPLPTMLSPGSGLKSGPVSTAHGPQ